MYTIHFTGTNGDSRTWTYSGENKKRLALFLAQFPLPIVAVFEQMTPVTEAVRSELRKWQGVLSMSNAAREFMSPATHSQTTHQS